jgi:hypothetical protein
MSVGPITLNTRAASDGWQRKHKLLVGLVMKLEPQDIWLWPEKLASLTFGEMI